MNKKTSKIPPNSKFNKLTILGYDEVKKKYKCKCDCGNVTFVAGNKILSNHTKSCGCYRYEFGKKNRKYGLYKDRIYFEWKNMIYRCYKTQYPYYKYYGGRGIKVCDEWFNNVHFFRDWALQNWYQDDLTLDRINTNGNYYPDNCRWVSMHTQTRNTRRNINIIYNGEKHFLSDLCEKLNINISTIRALSRSRNITIDEAIKLKTTKKYNKHTNRWEDK